jgi:hypothetical protein
MTDPSAKDIHRGMFITAVVMVLVGTVVGMAGLAVAGTAVIASGRRWSRRVELSFYDLAKLKLGQARAAAGSVAGAWRDADVTGH